MENKNNKNILLNKKSIKGFTLVELLAVIVILAIIMIIAIPAVLQTMQSARRKTFSEYATKVSTEAQKTYLADQLVSNPGSCVLYDIKKDLGLSSTGDYDGYVIVKNANNDTRIYVTLKDSEYMIYGVDGNKLDTVEVKKYVDGEYLSDINLLSVAKCENYSVVSETVTDSKYEQKTATLIPTPFSSTPIEKKLLTGEKEGSGHWVGVYENGNIVDCYSLVGSYDFNTAQALFNGSRETSFCTGKATFSEDESVCRAKKSTICCTASNETEAASPLEAYTYFISNNDQTGNKPYACGRFNYKCGNTYCTYYGGSAIGGGLPESGVYEE